jgi:DNA-binding CsgD family transcriptional regulator/tetratricopeptide (TPR) repeat protein
MLMLEQTKKQELTSRQKEILSLLRKGLTNNEICKALNISANTVKVHLANIYKILEVTNRTEAVTSGMSFSNDKEDGPKDLNIVFHIKGEIPENTKAYNLYLTIVEAIHQFRIFRITETKDACPNPGFQIEVSASEDKEETLHISAIIGNSSELLWTTSIKINTDEISVLAQKSAIQLFRSIAFASAKLQYSPESPIPYWWYATTLCFARIENRCQDSFEICKQLLTPLVSSDSYNEFALYLLSKAYYIAIIENWGDAKENFEALNLYARKAMHNAPYSLYSQMVMALYNITIGNKAEAVAYLRQVIEANPQFVTARSILTQIYMLTGQDTLAMELIDDNLKCVPESALQATYQARAFILLMQDKYSECKKLANQILLFTPKAMAVRLIMIVCCNIMGETAESEEHIKKLHEHYPNLTKKDVEQLLKGVAESRKTFFMSHLHNLFPTK